MAMPALKYEVEEVVEERVAVLEAHVEHIRAGISDIKVDVRKLNDKIEAVDAKLTARIDAVDAKLTDKIDAVDRKLSDKIEAVDKKLTDSFAELKISRAADRVWWLLMSAALLGVMARGMHWM